MRGGKNQSFRIKQQQQQLVWPQEGTSIEQEETEGLNLLGRGEKEIDDKSGLCESRGRGSRDRETI